MISPGGASPFLEVLELDLPVHLSREAPALVELLASSDLKLAALIRSADISGRANQADATDLEDLLLRQLSSDRSNKRRVIRWLRIVYAAISRMNRLGALIHPTRLAIDIEPPKSPFQAEHTALGVRAAGWENALFEWIRSSLGELPKAEPPDHHMLHAAAIAMSAALCGGLLESKNLLALIRRAPEPLRAAGSQAYYDFESVHAGVRVLMLRRWFPDPLTEALLVRLKPDDAPDQVTERNLLKGMKQIIGKERSPPGSLTSLATGAAALWSQRGSQVDVRIARGAVLTQSLKLDAWLRQNRSRPLSIVEESQVSKTTAPATEAPDTALNTEMSSLEDDPSEVDLELTIPWLTDFLRLAEVSASEESFELQRNRMANAVADWKFGKEDEWAEPYRTWLHTMLTGTSASGDRMALSTIRQYFRSVVLSLIGMIGSRNPSELPAGELDAWYGELIEPLPPGRSRIVLANGLREFHVHLQKAYKVSRLNLGDVLGKETELSAVDARIVNLDEMYAAMTWLEARVGEGQFPALMQAISLVLLLTFRCGLRRMEGLKLRLCDLHPAGRGDLRIVPHAARGLKSRSSERNLPLRFLLTEEEWDKLHAWWRHRCQEATSSAGRLDAAQYLFAIPRLGMAELPTQTVIDNIHQALREVTGDPLIHLHHLRHSFATWTYLRLRIGLHPSLADHFKQWPMTHAWLASGAEFVRNMLPGANPGARSAAYATARLLGHSGPGVSFEHYIHCSDLLWAGLAYRQAQRLPRSLLIAATGLPRVTGYRKLDRSIDTLISALRTRRRERYLFHEPISQAADPVSQGIQPADSSYAWEQLLQKISSILHCHDCGESVTQIARQTGLNPDEVEWVIERAKNLVQRIRWHSRDGREALRLCPPSWKGVEEKRFGTDLRAALIRLHETHPELLVDGLQTALSRFNPQRKDIVFRSLDEASEARRFLDFASALGPAACKPVVVFRDTTLEELANAADESQCPHLAWGKVLELPDGSPTCTSSQNPDKTAYRRWLGFHLMSPGGKPYHLAAIGVFLVMLIGIEFSGKGAAVAHP